MCLLSLLAEIEKIITKTHVTIAHLHLARGCDIMCLLSLLAEIEKVITKTHVTITHLHLARGCAAAHVLRLLLVPAVPACRE
jgi:hypothetical protein